MINCYLCSKLTIQMNCHIWSNFWFEMLGSCILNLMQDYVLCYCCSMVYVGRYKFDVTPVCRQWCYICLALSYWCVNGLVPDCNNSSVSNGVTTLVPSHLYQMCIDGLVQDCSISSALAMEILQSCTKPSVYHLYFDPICHLYVNCSCKWEVLVIVVVAASSIMWCHFCLWPS